MAQVNIHVRNRSTSPHKEGSSTKSKNFQNAQQYFQALSAAPNTPPNPTQNQKGVKKTNIPSSLAQAPAHVTEPTIAPQAQTPVPAVTTPLTKTTPVKTKENGSAHLETKEDPPAADSEVTQKFCLEFKSKGAPNKIKELAEKGFRGFQKQEQELLLTPLKSALKWVGIKGTIDDILNSAFKTAIENKDKNLLLFCLAAQGDLKKHQDFPDKDAQQIFEKLNYVRQMSSRMEAPTNIESLINNVFAMAIHEFPPNVSIISFFLAAQHSLATKELFTNSSYTHDCDVLEYLRNNLAQIEQGKIGFRNDGEKNKTTEATIKIIELVEQTKTLINKNPT